MRVQVDLASLQRFGPVFVDLLGRLHRMYEHYSNEELEIVLRFLTEVTELQRAATDTLRELDLKP